MLTKLKTNVPIAYMYNSIIQPYIDHCTTVWGYAPDVHVNKVQSLQNRIARIISGVYDFKGSARQWWNFVNLVTL